MQCHYFIAIRLPKEVKHYLSEVANQVSDAYSFKRWVHKEDYHITLAFLGSSTERQWKDCMEEIRSELTGVSAFPIRISHCGTFGSAEKPRIFWCGMPEDKSLQSLQKKVAEVCKRHQFRLDEKTFRPHITLARKYESDVPFTQSDLQKCNSYIGEGITFTANAITLYESHVEKVQKYKELQTIYI